METGQEIHTGCFRTVTAVFFSSFWISSFTFLPLWKFIFLYFLWKISDWNTRPGYLTVLSDISLPSFWVLDKPQLPQIQCYQISIIKVEMAHKIRVGIEEHNQQLPVGFPPSDLKSNRHLDQRKFPKGFQAQSWGGIWIFRGKLFPGECYYQSEISQNEIFFWCT